MPDPGHRILQELAGAHALEGALAQMLATHLAITPRSEYRDALERHLAATRAHAETLAGRMAEIGGGRTALRQAYDVAQAALGQVLAAGRLPLDLLRGIGGEERLLRHAREEAASAAFAIATYDALEALAAAAGDRPTAKLARAHRGAEERFLAELRAAIPQLARDVHAARLDEEPAPARPPVADVQAAAKAAAGEVRAGTRRKPSRRAPGKPSRAPRKPS